VPLSVFSRAKARISIPLVAIGGIDAGNAGRVMAAGADMISVVSSVFSKRRVARAVAELKLSVGEEKYVCGKMRTSGSR
jgi:thiamine-phosphate pyrophosphorylase